MIKTCIAISPDQAEFAPLLFAGSLDEGLENAAQLGFDGVELNLRDSDCLDQQMLLDKINGLGLRVPSIGTGQSYIHDHLSLGDTCDDVQVAVRERLKGHVRFANQLNAKVVIGGIRGNLDAGTIQSRRIGYAVAVDAVKEISTYAEDYGVSLLIEPINRYETNFLNTIDETLEFIEKVGCLNVGLLADTFHMNIEEADMTQSLIRADNLLWHLHFADSNRCAPGMGHINFMEIVETIKKIDFEGYVSGEILPLPDSFHAAKKWMEIVQPMIQREVVSQ